MSLSNGHHESDLSKGTALLAQLRREELRALQEYGENSAQARRAGRMLFSAEIVILPDPTDAAAVTAYLQQLKADLDWTREHAPGYGLDAFNLYYAEANRLGRNLSALPEYSPDEATRFFAKVVHGTGGHAYWTGGQDFFLNSGGQSRPSRWWYRHAIGELSEKVLLKPGCGQPRCIAPGHQVEAAKGVARRFTEDELIGKLQAVALRLGHSPTREEWRELEMVPTTGTYEYTFGNWNGALGRAGLEPKKKEFSAEECLWAIRYVRSKLGRWPTVREFLAHSEQLIHKGLPGSAYPIDRHYGTFAKARDAAKHLTDAPGVR